MSTSGKNVPPFSVKIHTDTEDATTTTESTRGSSPDDGNPAVVPAKQETGTADGQQTCSAGSAGWRYRRRTERWTEKTTGTVET